jgi:hypothetical protein
MIGIFRTNIDTDLDKNKVIDAIYANFNISMCSVDTDDCDKVLRVVARQLPIAEITVIRFIQHMGYQCELLD